MECGDYNGVPPPVQPSELTSPSQVMAVKTGEKNSAGKATEVPLSSPQEGLGAPGCEPSPVHQSGSGSGQAQPTLTPSYPAQHTGAGAAHQSAEDGSGTSTGGPACQTQWVGERRARDPTGPHSQSSGRIHLHSDAGRKRWEQPRQRLQARSCAAESWRGQPTREQQRSSKVQLATAPHDNAGDEGAAGTDRATAGAAEPAPEGAEVEAPTLRVEAAGHKAAQLPVGEEGMHRRRADVHDTC